MLTKTSPTRKPGSLDEEKLSYSSCIAEQNFSSKERALRLRVRLLVLSWRERAQKFDVYRLRTRTKIENPFWTLSFEVNAFINCKILCRKGWMNSIKGTVSGDEKFKVTRVPRFFQNQPYFLWASCLKVVFYCARKFSFLSCGYNSHIDIFNVPLLILRNKTVRKRVWKYPSWLI